MKEATELKIRWATVSALVFTGFLSLFNASQGLKGMWLGIAAINFIAVGVCSHNASRPTKN